MKKNFLKKLAFTMAFATVFTTLAPAAGVFAAKAPSLTVGKKLTLLLGTERESHDINVNNKVSGSKYAWSTSNKAVATVNSKGIVEGQKTGSAKVTLKITLPTKKTATLSTTVDVKDNIKEVAINNAPKEALKVGEEHDFNRTIVKTFGGNTKAHKGAVTRWFLNETETATINDSGVFKATAAGEYEVTAKSFQSKAKYNEYLKSGDEKLVTATSETVKVTVKASLVDASLVTPNQVELTFDSSVKDVVKSAADVKIETVATSKAIIPVKGIKSVSEDGKTVVVDTYADFANDTTYKVVAAGSSFEFKAQIGTIASITIENQQVSPITNTADAKTLKYTVKDEYGVDITAKYPIGGLMQVITAGTSSSYIDVTNGKIMMFAKGDVISVQLKYLRYDATTGADTSIVSNVATVTGVESTASLTSNWTINATNNFDKINHSVAAEDNTKTLWVKVKDNYGTETVNSNMKFTSLDTSVLLVDATSGKLFPLKAGSAVVKVESGNYVDYLTISVTAKIEATKLVADTQSYRLSNSTQLGKDSKTIKFTLKDNYDQTLSTFNGTGTVKAVSVSNVDAIAVSGNTLAVNAETSFAVVDGEGTVTFTVNDNTKVGTSSYLVTVNGKTTVVTISVVAPQGASAYRIELSSNELDSFKSETAALELYSTDANGVKVSKVTAITGTAITYTVKDSAGNTKVNNATLTANTEVVSAGYANGTYTVYVNIGPIVTTATYTVKSSKLASSVTVDRVYTNVNTTILAAIQDSLTAKVNGSSVADSNITNADVTILNTSAVSGSALITDAIAWSNGQTVLPVYVKNVTVVYDGVTYVVDVNQVITINK